jgi:hypothetical protein
MLRVQTAGTIAALANLFGRKGVAALRKGTVPVALAHGMV